MNFKDCFLVDFLWWLFISVVNSWSWCCVRHMAVCEFHNSAAEVQGGVREM